MKQPFRNRISRIIAIALLQVTLFLASAMPLDFCLARSPIGYDPPLTTLTYSRLPSRCSALYHIGRTLPFKNLFVCLISRRQLDLINRRCHHQTTISFKVNRAEVYSFDIINVLLDPIAFRSLDYHQLYPLKG